MVADHLIDAYLVRPDSVQRSRRLGGQGAATADSPRHRFAVGEGFGLVDHVEVIPLHPNNRCVGGARPARDGVAGHIRAGHTRQREERSGNVGFTVRHYGEVEYLRVVSA